MPRRKRKLSANDLRVSAPSPFGETVVASDKYPTILSISVSATYEGLPDYDQPARMAYPGTLRPFFNCKNRDCHGGGFHIEALLDEMVRKNETSSEKATMKCIGRLGKSPRSPTCMSFLNDIRISITYKSTGE